MAENKYSYRDKLRKSLKEVDSNIDTLFESLEGDLIKEVKITIKTVLGDEVDVSYELTTDNYLLQHYSGSGL